MSANENYSLKILVIDDNVDDYETVKRVAKKIAFPCKLHWCSSGKAGIEYLQENVKKSNSLLPNIIFLDINMPGMDGKQTLEILKSDKDLKMIPVLMFTTSNHDKDVKECYRLGANSYIQKPHSYKDLIEVFKIIDKYWLNVTALPPYR